MQLINGGIGGFILICSNQTISVYKVQCWQGEETMRDSLHCDILPCGMVGKGKSGIKWFGPHMHWRLYKPRQNLKVI